MEQPQLTEDQAAGIAVLGLCCCLMAAIGLVVLIVWLVRRGSAATPHQQYQPPPPGQQPPQSTAQQGTLHLSVLAVAFDGFFRDQVAQVLAAPTLATNALGQRVELVQRVARALLGIEPQWRQFGYGEKDLADMGSAQQSFTLAAEEFRNRANTPGDGGQLVVLTLIIATRTHLLGVDRLDQRSQVRAMLEDRARLDPNNLLGADALWTPVVGGMSEQLVRDRFPEMHPLVG